MPNPTPYQLSYSFSGWQAANPDRPLPAQRVDIEFQNIQFTTGEIIAALAQVRRSDGKLANASVDLAALSDEVIRELGGAGAGSGDGVIFATQAQAEAGTSTAVVMSPLRTRQAIAKFGGGGGTTPGGPIDIDDVEGLTDALAGKSNAGHTHSMGQVGGLTDALNGKQAALGFTPEDRTNRGKSGGYASLGSDGKVPAAQLPAFDGGTDNAAEIFYYPSPEVLVPVAQRLGAEVYLTDGYVEGSNLTDFSDLIEANLARAVATKRPFIIPQGLFKAKRQFVANDTGIAMMGYGKMQSAIQWTADAASSGFRFSASANTDKPDFMHFRDLALFTEQHNVGEALWCSFEKQIIQSGGDELIFDRYSTRFRAQDVAIRGSVGRTANGWNKGITVLYEIDAILRDCQFEGPIIGAHPNYGAEWAFYIGAANGRGRPTGPFVDTCNVFHAKRAVVFEGNEGGVVTNSQLVGVIVGVDFVDNSGRPLLMVTNTHINAFSDCIRVDAASQIQIIGNSLYHTIGTDRDGRGVSINGTNARSQHAVIVNNCFESAIGSNQVFTGVAIFGCDHGVIDGNTFRSGSVQGQPQNMKGVVLAANARFFKVGQHNVFEDPQSGRNALISTVEDGGQENRLPAKGARYVKSGGQYASGETVVTFEGFESVIGGVESMADGAFTVPVSGLWTFTFGIVATPASGGHILAIKKNGLGITALVSDSKDYQGSSPIAMHVTTGPVLVNKGDTLYPVFNSTGSTVNAHPATFFEARRTY